LREAAATPRTQIATAEQLDLVRGALDACYVLTADIDLAEAAWKPIGAMKADSSDESGETTNMD
jgi:hypothetical protein